MVDLSGSSDPFQQSIPNAVFYAPAVIVFGLAATSKSCRHRAHGTCKSATSTCERRRRRQYYRPVDSKSIDHQLTKKKKQKNKIKMEDQIIHEETLIDRDVEVGSGLGNMINSGKFEMPSMEDIMKLIDGMKDISDEERENLKSSIMFPDTDKMRQKFESATQPGPGSIDYFLFMAMIGLIALVFGLFGYKLYKSLMEKKLKKQEKQKNNKKSKKIKQK